MSATTPTMDSPQPSYRVVPKEDNDQLLEISMGPHHPSTHGVFRMDVVLDGELPQVLAEDLLAYVGCVAGAMRREKYFGAIEAAGLSDIDVLSDTDFLASVKETLPPEMLDKIAQSGIRPQQLEGLVRSVTFRAGKR